MHLFLVCMPRASLFSHIPNTQWVREICLWTSWWSKFVKKHCGLAAVTPWCLGHQARRAPLRSEHWVRTWCCHQPPAKKQNGRITKRIENGKVLKGKGWGNSYSTGRGNCCLTGLIEFLLKADQGLSYQMRAGEFDQLWRIIKRLI